MNASEINDVVRQARSLVQLGWTSAHYAINAGRVPVGSCSSDATAWCIAGAIDNVVRHDEEAFREVWHAVVKQFKPGTVNSDIVRTFSGYSQRQAVNFFSLMLGETTASSPESSETTDAITRRLLA